MTRTERIRKLTQAIRDYRGSYNGRTGALDTAAATRCRGTRAALARGTGPGRAGPRGAD